MVKKRKKSVYYINPKELIEEIQKFKDDGTITEKLGEMILNIAKRYASRPNFNGYSYKEDFIGEAVYRMIEQLDKIDLNHPKCNPFSYLTQICHYKFIAKINKEEKFRKTKERLKDHLFDKIEQSEGIHFNKNPEEENEY